MKRSGFIWLAKHRKFDYQPLYYNERQERLQNQVDAIKQEMGKETSENYNTPEARASRIKFSRHHSRNMQEKASRQSVMIRTFLILFFSVNIILFWIFGWTDIFQWTLIGELVVFYGWFRGRQIFGKKKKDDT